MDPMGVLLCSLLSGRHCLAFKNFEDNCSIKTRREHPFSMTLFLSKQELQNDLEKLVDVKSGDQVIAQLEYHSPCWLAETMANERCQEQNNDAMKLESCSFNNPMQLEYVSCLIY